MKRNLLIVVVIYSLCFNLVTSGWSQSTTYFNIKTDLSLKHYDDYCYTVVENDSTYVAYGNAMDGAYNYSTIVCGLNSTGNQEWLKEWGSDYPDNYAAQHGGLIKYNDSLWFSLYTSVYYTGTTYYWHIFLQCHNAALDTLWTMGFKEDTVLLATTLIKTMDGGLAIGSFRLDNAGFHIRKLSNTFETEWVKTVSLFDGFKYDTYTIAQTSDSGFALSGRRFNTWVDGDPVVTKINASGNLEWWLNFGGQFEDFGALVCTTNDGSLIVGNILNLYEINSYLWGRINISKMDNQGNVSWNKLYGNLGIGNTINSIIGLEDGGLLACGYVSHDAIAYLGWMLRLDEQGDSVWYREYSLLANLDELHWLQSAIPCSDKGFMAVGTIPNLFTNPDTDSWLLKVDSLGCVAEGDCWVGISDNEENHHHKNQMLSFRCSPNPALHTLNIQWAGNANVLEVYTLHGQLLFNQHLDGLTQFPISTINWPQGVYILKLFSPNGNTCNGKFIKI